ncbi:MAG: hypothetical protein JW736_06760 [Deltaproteobacteria bacterium]|nr:hypothetical protein [Deltaproteobacteria bacterium]MBN2688171.1 hypothetical protein [Deltaproteobacteria bacterium]
MAGLVFLILSCHSDYVSLDYRVHHGACWNNDHSRIAFVASKKAYLRATGLARLPDGGIPKYLIDDMGLYVFTPEDQHLSRLVDFNDLTHRLSSSRSLWKVKIAFDDSLVHYSVTPVTEWAFYLKHAKSPDDSLVISNLQKKYEKTYAVDINTKNVVETDPALLQSLYKKSSTNNKIGLTAFNKYLADIPLSEWGLVVREIHPKSEEAYIEETIFLYNSSSETRRAVIEQIISKKSKTEIKAILKKMDDYAQSLKGLKKKEYEIYSEDTYKRIQSLL